MNNSNKSRIHTVYHNSKGEKVPSVTTILQELSKPALIHWAWDLGTKGIDYRKYRDELARIGTLAHKMILCHLSKAKLEMDEYSKDEIATAENCFLSYLEWEKGHKLEPKFLELSTVSEKHNYGGTFDYYGLIDGVSTLMDFKTGKAIYPDYFYQIAAYAESITEFGLPISQIQILNIPRAENERFEVESKSRWEDEWEIFRAALQIYNAKRRIKEARGA